MTKTEWEAEGRKRFGDDVLDWKFVCPSCGYVASVRDWVDAAPDTIAVGGMIAFSCVGRLLNSPQEAFSKGGPCNYAGGGLIRLNPVEVDDNGTIHHVFDFAPAE